MQQLEVGEDYRIEICMVSPVEASMVPQPVLVAFPLA